MAGTMDWSLSAKWTLVDYDQVYAQEIALESVLTIHGRADGWEEPTSVVSSRTVMIIEIISAADSRTGWFYTCVRGAETRWCYVYWMSHGSKATRGPRKKLSRKRT